MEAPAINNGQSEQIPVNREVANSFLTDTSVGLEKPLNVNTVGSEQMRLREDRAKLDFIIKKQQEASSLNPIVESSSVSNPFFKLYLSLSELQTGLEEASVHEKNPVIRLGLKILSRLNGFSLFLLADILGLKDKKKEEDEEKRKEDMLKQQKLAHLESTIKHPRGGISKDDKLVDGVKVVGGLK